MKFQLPSCISVIVTAVGTIGRVMLMNFNVAFSLSLVLSSQPPDEPLWIDVLCHLITLLHDVVMGSSRGQRVGAKSSWAVEQDRCKQKRFTGKREASLEQD